jgi:hypothetical protein
LGGPILIARWGVGPIRSGSYFESPRIRELFPKAQVRDDVVRISDDETLAVITVDEDGRRELEIDDGASNFPGTNDPKIGAVRAVGGPVRGPGGETPGMSWNAAGFDMSQCELGVERDEYHVICARPGDGAVTYIFALPGWRSDENPPRAVLGRGYLADIVWTPPPGRKS